MKFKEQHPFPAVQTFSSGSRTAILQNDLYGTGYCVVFAHSEELCSGPDQSLLDTQSNFFVSGSWGAA